MKRKRIVPVIIVSDTFEQFAGPLLKKLDWPTLFCNTLEVAADQTVTGYTLRQTDGKHKATLALRQLNYEVIAMGDSYNDISMLKAADHGILFRPPENVIAEFPDLPVTNGYDEIKTVLAQLL